MALLVDTQTLLWIAGGDRRMSAVARQHLTSGREVILVSAVTAFEYTDLNDRGRFGADLSLQPILDTLEANVIDFPASAWTLLASLPAWHRDPVDRMLIAHAIVSDATLVTADKTMRAYPVRSLW